MKDKGWDIKHIAENNIGIDDREVMVLSILESRIIITFDSDYGELVYKHGYNPKGIIYLRIQNFTSIYPGELLLKLIEIEELKVEGFFTVVDDNQIRQRKL